MDAVISTPPRTRAVPRNDAMQPQPANDLRVLLVDDHEFIRVGVRSACAELGGRRIDWTEAGTLAEAIHHYADSPRPFDAVLLDLNLADCKGLQGLRQFLQAHPQARVAVFSGTHDEFVVRQARALGAVAYISKGAGAAELQAVLQQVLLNTIDGGNDATATTPTESPNIYRRVAELGPRHLEIMELVLSGCTNQEISQATQLSLGTVKNYVSSLLLALDVKSRSHLISLFR
ncbi:MAG: hypothetical protein RJA44_1743 [Pseudomonadota bacterium]|jgi:NarL family two-component system response regulator LiaR